MVIDYLKIKNFMSKNGIKQNQLAKKLNWQPYRVSQFLNGKTNPTLSILEKVADALGVDLLTFSDFQKHEISFLNDVRMKKVIRDFGTEGIGIFMLIYQNSPILKEDLEVVFPVNHYDKAKIDAIINDYGLFSVNNNIVTVNN